MSSLIDSQGSADTSRSQHTDVTSELSSVVSVPDKTGMCSTIYKYLYVHQCIWSGHISVVKNCLDILKLYYKYFRAFFVWIVMSKQCP